MDDTAGSYRAAAPQPRGGVLDRSGARDRAARGRRAVRHRDRHRQGDHEGERHHHVGAVPTMTTRAQKKEPGWRGRLRRRLRGDRGAVTVELVIATPLLLLMLLAIVQFALWSHATHIAQAAASQGLAAARVQNGT